MRLRAVLVLLGLVALACGGGSNGSQVAADPGALDVLDEALPLEVAQEAAEAERDVAPELAPELAPDPAADPAADPALETASDLAGDPAADPSPETEPLDTTAAEAEATDPGSDPGTPCTANPFVAAGPAVDWNHSFTTGVETVLQGAANHRGQDVVVNPGQLPVLIGKFAYGTFDKDLKDEWVEVWIQLDPPCGAWTKLGEVLTSEDGEYGTQYGIEDDGGRVFFPIDASAAPGPGAYPIVMLVKGDLSMAAFNLFVVKPGRRMVLTDIDGTMTTSDFQLVAELFMDIFSGSFVPAMYADANTVMQRYHDKGYDLVYVTGRPDMLKDATRNWLDQQGFPRGVIHLTDTNAQALPTASGVQAYKTDFLQLLIGTHGVAIDYAYGNATTDIGAYAAVGIAKDRTFIIGANGGTDGTQALTDYTSHLPYVDAVPQAVQP